MFFRALKCQSAARSQNSLHTSRPGAFEIQFSSALNVTTTLMNRYQTQVIYQYLQNFTRTGPA